MKNTFKKIKARLFKPLDRYIDNKIKIKLSDIKEEVEDIESKVDGCVSLDYFGEEISYTDTFQDLESQVGDLRRDIDYLEKENVILLAKLNELKGEDNE